MMEWNGIRGGVFVITHRFAEANNKYTPTYDASKPNSYLMYWDANNLYGWSMPKPLPVCEFRWLNDEEISKINVE